MSCRAGTLLWHLLATLSNLPHGLWRCRHVCREPGTRSDSPRISTVSYSTRILASQRWVCTPTTPRTTGKSWLTPDAWSEAMPFSWATTPARVPMARFRRCSVISCVTKGCCRWRMRFAKLLPCRRSDLGSKIEGILRNGFAADLVVFDPLEIHSPATLESPRQFPLGISHVMVNGVLVIDDGEHTGVLPGRVLRNG